MDIDSLLLCASGAAYNITGNVYKPQDNELFSQQFVWENQQPVVYVGGTLDADACFVGKCAAGIIVAARGTIHFGQSPSQPNYFDDWLTDFDCKPVAWQNFADGARQPGAALPGLVHQGFYGAVQHVWSYTNDGAQLSLFEQVLAYRTDPSIPVYVTGHSKGGGMAPLLAYLLQFNGIDVTKVVTFAAPKSGEANFQLAYNGLLGKLHTRYENYGDIIPFLWPAQNVADDILKALLSVLPKWPELSDLVAAIQRLEQWNYQPVGSEVFISWSLLTGNQSPVTDPGEIATWQGRDFGLNLLGQLVLGHSIGDILMIAHTLAPCYSSRPVVGYFSYLCPELIPASCDTVQLPPALTFK